MGTEHFQHQEDKAWGALVLTGDVKRVEQIYNEYDVIADIHSKGEFPLYFSLATHEHLPIAYEILVACKCIKCERCKLGRRKRSKHPPWSSVRLNLSHHLTDGRGHLPMSRERPSTTTCKGSKNNAQKHTNVEKQTNLSIQCSLPGKSGIFGLPPTAMLMWSAEYSTPSTSTVLWPVNDAICTWKKFKIGRQKRHIYILRQKSVEQLAGYHNRAENSTQRTLSQARQQEKSCESPFIVSHIIAESLTPETQ